MSLEDLSTYVDTLGNRLSDPPHMKRSLIDTHPDVIERQKAKHRPAVRDEGYNSPSSQRLKKGNN